MTDTLLVERLTQLVDPRIGILRWMMEGNLQPDEPPLHIAYCEFSNPLKLRPARITEEQWQAGAIEEGRQTFDVRSGALNPVGRKHATGAGADRETALWAAVGEACERYAMHLDSGYRSLWAREAEVPGPVVSPDRFIRFDEAQYDDILFPFSRYEPSRPLQWRKAVKLPAMEDVWVPSQMVSGPLERTEYQILDVLYSTGCAAGGSPAHAVTGAIREVIERDAFMFYWLSGHSPRRIDIEAVSPYLPEWLRELLTWQGLEVHVLWLETDHKIPSICTLLMPRFAPGVAIGASAHLDWRQALEKATVEAFHTLNWVSDMDRWNMAPPGIEAVRDFSDHVAFYRDDSRRELLQALLGGTSIALEPPVDLPSIDDHRAHVAAMVERLSACGLETYVVNLTPADLASIDLHVARALIPGMHPIHAGTGVEHLDRRRLEAVASSLGLELPSTLNLVPHPFP